MNTNNKKTNTEFNYRIEVKPMHIHEAARRALAESIGDERTKKRMPVLGFGFVESLSDAEDLVALLPYTWPGFDKYLDIFLPILNELLNEFPGKTIFGHQKTHQNKNVLASMRAKQKVAEVSKQKR